MGSNAKVSEAGRFALLPHQYPASPTRFPFMQAETPLRRNASPATPAGCSASFLRRIQKIRGMIFPRAPEEARAYRPPTFRRTEADGYRTKAVRPLRFR